MSHRETLKLSESFYFLNIDGEGLALDLKKNKYFGLPFDMVQVLEQIETGRSSEVARHERARQLIELSLKKGFLEVEGTRSSSLRKKRSNQRAQKEICGSKLNFWSLIALGTLPFARSIYKYSTATNNFGLLRRFSRRESSGVSQVENRLRGTLWTYQFLRKPFRQGTEDCMERSSILFIALAMVRVFSDLTIGCQKFPLACHAWVELDGYVVNDDLEYTSKYQIIARI